MKDHVLPNVDNLIGTDLPFGDTNMAEAVPSKVTTFIDKRVHCKPKAYAAREMLEICQHNMYRAFQFGDYFLYQPFFVELVEHRFGHKLPALKQRLIKQCIDRINASNAQLSSERVRDDLDNAVAKFSTRVDKQRLILITAIPRPVPESVSRFPCVSHPAIC
eukprot:TRINITY_DN4390_c0_g1_i1.p2 TRINITY_DN4390_c0_g1~~TRINITY_DN4390_c0_g1_i1.p2  ORF type:complete len:162 (+),score=22.00 TRINITY_DN4390_c0_g1_i1:2396-2881(+)